jgi:hypothetical protein
MERADRQAVTRTMQSDMISQIVCREPQEYRDIL